ncbi:response regulator [Burkholderiaceae bacterium DAT-1]|nr:response regulator [Burkholderiaceae bacterium DAT-1]
MERSLLVVDDDPWIVSQIQAILGDMFDIRHADSASAVMPLLDTFRPHIILLDINLPEMDGYDICLNIRSNDDWIDIPIVFLSANVEVDDRLKAYNVGGSAYITKPFVPRELRKQIEIINENSIKHDDLRSMAATASAAAISALSAAADIGRIMSFQREISCLTHFEDISAASFHILHEYGLEGCIQLRSRTGNVSRSNNGEATSLEESVLKTMASCARIVDLGTRSAFNFPHVSIIINNMPKGNADSYGRIKDNVMTIADAIDIHMNTLELMVESVHRNEALLELLKKNTATLREIEGTNRRQREESSDILSRLINDIESAFVYLGLSESQERRLQNMARDAVIRAQALTQESLAMEALIESNASLMESHEGIEAALNSEVKKISEAAASRIELF